MYLVPYVPLAYRERDGSYAFNEHMLVVGRIDGLELGVISSNGAFSRERSRRLSHHNRYRRALV